ncbi:hypothetical protein KSP40_PGU002918 [Platanthera guangdongensis]|uniref:Uncharacterized protein n=1 Tax=Platanthera guangdongensis TaxID=2320717 RepID=A0ABR2MJE2_9ASPA
MGPAAAGSTTSDRPGLVGADAVEPRATGGRAAAATYFKCGGIKSNGTEPERGKIGNLRNVDFHLSLYKDPGSATKPPLLSFAVRPTVDAPSPDIPISRRCYPSPGSLLFTWMMSVMLRMRFVGLIGENLADRDCDFVLNGLIKLIDRIITVEYSARDDDANNRNGHSLNWRGRGSQTEEVEIVIEARGSWRGAALIMAVVPARATSLIPAVTLEAMVLKLEAQIMIDIAGLALFRNSVLICTFLPYSDPNSFVAMQPLAIEAGLILAFRLTCSYVLVLFPI